jgi:hypothetical protein
MGYASASILTGGCIYADMLAALYACAYEWECVGRHGARQCCQQWRGYCGVLVGGLAGTFPDCTVDDIEVTTIGGLPGSPTDGTVRIVTDGTSETDCQGSSGNVCLSENGEEGTTSVVIDDDGGLSNIACDFISTFPTSTIALVQDSEADCEFALQVDVNASIGTTYDFRVYDSAGSALDAYDVTPTMTVRSLRASME